MIYFVTVKFPRPVKISNIGEQKMGIFLVRGIDDQKAGKRAAAFFKKKYKLTVKILSVNEARNQQYQEVI